MSSDQETKPAVLNPEAGIAAAVAAESAEIQNLLDDKGGSEGGGCGCGGCGCGA